MTRNIACSFLLLIITASFGNSIMDVEEEDPDYEKDFERYDTFGDWIQLSSEVFEWGPMNVRGRLRKRFALGAALSIPESSMVCSPIGALFTLGMLALGAEGDCLKQLLISIGLSERSELTRCLKPLMKQLDNMNGVNISTVSKMYVSNDYQITSKFKQRTKKIFNSNVELVNFKTPLETTRTINNFIYENTNGMIPDIVSQSDIMPQESMFLISAVYFTAQWKTKFEEIKLGNFSTPQSGVARIVTMMTKTGQFNYMNSQNLEAQIVEIPYLDENLSFVLILPNEKDGLLKVLEKMKASPEHLQEVMQGLQLTEMVLTIPKFKTEAQLDLRISFEWLGIIDMLQTTNSGLEGIVKRNKTIHMSQGLQRVLIDINEKGEEPSAINTLYFSGLDNQTDLTTLTANYPFLYFVKFKREQIILGTYA